MDKLIIVPTYNERDNVSALLDRLLELPYGLEVLVVDDNSPDGTGDVVLDETPIGNFGEIEGPPEWIDRTAQRLGVNTRQYITSNYATLFLDWKKRSHSKAKQMTFQEIGDSGPTL